MHVFTPSKQHYDFNIAHCMRVRQVLSHYVQDTEVMSATKRKKGRPTLQYRKRKPALFRPIKAD